MKVFFPVGHDRHRPTKDYSDGLPPFDYPEKPERVGKIVEGLKAAGISDVTNIEATALDAAFDLHDHDYVEFLLALSKTLADGEEYLPSIFNAHLDQAPLPFQGGRYCREIGTPITPHTIDAALTSAATALAAADHTLATGGDSFALCRPPGHHAGKRRYGGYCFFNNAYLAATQLTKSGKQTAVLDIDYHIGDGSVEFASAAAPYVSLHAQPGRNYPYLGSMTDADLPNLTFSILPDGITGDAFLQQLNASLEAIGTLKPDALVLSLGFDILGGDHIQNDRTAITVDDFQRIGAAIGATGYPVIFILEGGYDIERLAPCTERFFGGFLSARSG